MNDEDSMNEPNAAAPSRWRAQLSALMDGDRHAADEACRAWAGDASARADWHTYHVIGEVLRSEDAACSAASDARFLVRLRERLAAEPVVLAPEVSRLPVRARRAWMAPAAVAAGFVAVAGVLLATRLATPQESRDAVPALARNPGVEAPATALAGLRPLPAPASTMATDPGGAASRDGAMLIRDPELDRYLAAHRQYANASPLVIPGGVVRGAAVVAAPGR
jgi:sigma-E factor negative regulatory protein RseA